VMIYHLERTSIDITYSRPQEWQFHNCIGRVPQYQN
jgi:hypothetical protein